METMAPTEGMTFLDPYSLGIAAVLAVAFAMCLVLRSVCISRRWRDLTSDAINKSSASEERYRTILNTVVDGIITISADGRIRDFNMAATKIFGYRLDEALGRNINILMPEPYASEHDGYIDNYLNTGVKKIIGIGREVTGKRKDDSTFPMELSVSQFKIAGEIQFVGIVRDITERTNLQRNLEEARVAAENANHAKSDFLSAMSHEIRTPMNGIIGMTDTLFQTRLKDSQIDMVKLISESAYSLLDIINGILDFSKIEAGKLDIERKPMNVASIMENACLLIDYMAKKNHVELTLFVDPEIPEEVLGDAVRLRQVLLNMVNNAIKFSGGRQQLGHVSVRTLLTGHGPEHVMVDILVSDDGIGIEESSQSKVFEPFEQADLSTTRLYGGSGLGLPIAKHLVELMGGEISLQSAQGVGSTFTVRLPLTPIPKVPEPNLASNIIGLPCLVIGGAKSLAADLAIYLKAAGAEVEQIPDLTAVHERIRKMSARPMVWIIDTGDETLPLNELRAIIHTLPRLDIRLVAIGRGNCHIPRIGNANVVRVDGNPLPRQTFLNAVAIATGKAQPEITIESDKTPGAAIEPISRDEALRKRRLILVAEDNKTNQKVILKQLALLGIFADIVDNGRDALERWKKNGYALILTDLHMPVMDGYELAAAIRAEENGVRHIPIIAYSASASMQDETTGRMIKIDDYLRKPVPLETLKKTLENWLARRLPDTEHPK